MLGTSTVGVLTLGAATVEDSYAVVPTLGTLSGGLAGSAGSDGAPSIGTGVVGGREVGVLTTVAMWARRRRLRAGAWQWRERRLSACWLPGPSTPVCS